MNRFSGSDFDDFLEKEGILGKVSAKAHKRLLALQLADIMKESNLTKTRLAERMCTSNFSLQPRYDDYERNIISGYGARSTIAVTLRDVQKLEPVLVAALEAGAATVDGIDFSITNLRALRDQARDQAVRAALEKARDMASAAGMAVGNVTQINKGAGRYYFGSGYGSRQWTNFQNVVQDLSAEGAITLKDGSISLGQIVVQAQVSLTAELVTQK